VLAALGAVGIAIGSLASLLVSVRQSLLKVTAQHNGRSWVTYARHPLYTFSRDKHPNQTTGEA